MLPTQVIQGLKSTICKRSVQTTISKVIDAAEICVLITINLSMTTTVEFFSLVSCAFICMLLSSRALHNAVSLPGRSETWGAGKGGGREEANNVTRHFYRRREDLDCHTWHQGIKTASTHVGKLFSPHSILYVKHAYLYCVPRTSLYSIYQKKIFKITNFGIPVWLTFRM